MDYKKVAEHILDLVGGKENVVSLAHCATRLRFVLIKESRVEEEGLERVAVVKGTFSTNGQYQIIIGAGTVNMIYDEIEQLLGSSGEETPQESKQKGHLIQRAVKFLSDIFVPIIPAIVAGGLMMGLFNVLNAPFFDGRSIIQLYPQMSGLASMINTFSNAPFVFLPVLIGFSATKKFGGNPYLGAAMGMIMVHPDLLNAYNLGIPGVEIPAWNLFGFQVASVGYQGTVLPILAVSWVLAMIEKKLHRVTPSWLDNLTTPLLAILITGFLTFVFLGPILRSAGDLLAAGITWLYASMGFLGGAIFGGFYAPIVLTGMHHSFIAVETQLIAAQAVSGGSFIFVTASMSNVAQGAAVLAVLMVSKNEKMKSLCSAAGISSLLGISEPAMFGVNLKLRYPFLAACIGSACGSAWIALRHVLAVSLGAAGLPGFISVKPNQYLDFAIGILISIVVAFILTLILAKQAARKQEQMECQESMDNDIGLSDHVAIQEMTAIDCPMDGIVKPMQEACDSVFASKAMGDGFVMVPENGKVYAPADGIVEFVFPTKHALGLTTKEGIAILIHCGMDTVKLEGEGFQVYVKEKAEVTKGMLLMEFDLAEMKAKGYEIETPVVLTNLGEQDRLELLCGVKRANEEILYIYKGDTNERR